MDIQKALFSMQDLTYRSFSSKLMPTVDPETVIGVRTPALRKMAKALAKDEHIGQFLIRLPHQYYEENNLHAFLICEIRDYDRCVAELERFLPYIDNWATCDGIRPRCFSANPEPLLTKISQWLASAHPYTVRFGIEMLMCHFLDARFEATFLDAVASIRSEEYYVNMMIAWYFATALAKQWESTVPYLEKCRLSPWVHRKTVQKAVESYRITADQKRYLKSLKCSL